MAIPVSKSIISPLLLELGCPNCKVLEERVSMFSVRDEGWIGRRICRVGSSWNRAWEAPMLVDDQGKGMGIANVAVVVVVEPVRKRRDDFLMILSAEAKVVAEKVGEVSE